MFGSAREGRTRYIIFALAAYALFITYHNIYIYPKNSNSGLPESGPLKDTNKPRKDAVACPTCEKCDKSDIEKRLKTILAEASSGKVGGDGRSVTSLPTVPMDLMDFETRKAYCYDLHGITANDNIEIVDVKGTRSHDRNLRMALYSSTTDIVSGSLKNQGAWEYDLIQNFWRRVAAAKESPATGIFLDIGANVGYWTLLGLDLGYNVFAIEPMHENVRLLKMTQCLNPQFEGKLTVVPVGLGVEKDTCHVMSGNDNVGDGHTICGDDALQAFKDGDTENNYSERAMISIARLDDILDTTKTHIAGMKIDIEGFERFALSKAGADKFFAGAHPPKVIGCELYHCYSGKDCDQGDREFITLMTDRGYHMQHPITWTNTADVFEFSERVALLSDTFLIRE